MKARRKVAVYIDYSIRVPNFNDAYNVFKAELFSDKNADIEQEEESEHLMNAYWVAQMAIPEIEQFYMKVKLLEQNTSYCGMKDFSTYFYNKEHEDKFFDDYSYNLYVDAATPNLQDIDVINVAQELLFEIVLVDEYRSKRKKSNTFFFLSKVRAYPQSLIFLGTGQKLNEDNYFAIWNPACKTDQYNKAKDSTFIEWFKDLEKKQKDLDEVS